MRIGLVYDTFDSYPWRDGDPPDADVEYEPEETVESLEEAVRHIGFEPLRIGTSLDLLARLSTLRLDAAINIAEASRSRNREAYAPILLEMAGIPCIGSDALTLSLSLDKAWTKDIVAAAGIRTPPYRIYRAEADVDPQGLPSPFPLFVKARYEGSSKGIATSSRVEDLDGLRAEVTRVVDLYEQDVIVEPFVSGGGEFTVAVVGSRPPRTLPVLQRAVERETRIGLHALERRGVPAKDYEYDLEGSLNPDLESWLQRDAIAVFDKLECLDFARVDFRVDSEGVPWFLEINPLPTFAPDGTFAIAAELAGKTYPEFLSDLLREAIDRATSAHAKSRSGIQPRHR
jgi:D-alanine-D-alanine ligase